MPRRDRILRRELFRWRGGAGVLAGAAWTPRTARLQGHQYRRLHDRASIRTISVVWLGSGAARRSRQPDSCEIVGIVARARSTGGTRIDRQILENRKARCL